MNGAALSRAPKAPSAWQFSLLAMIVPIALIGTIFWLQGEYLRGEELRRHARASFDRRIDVIGLLSEMRNAETNQRGYVITGDREFLTRYDDSRQRVDASLKQIEPLFRDDDDQHGRIVELKQTAASKFAEMDTVVRQYATSPASARERVADGSGKRLMLRFQTVGEAVIADEEKIGLDRVAAFGARSRAIQVSMWLVVALISVALATALILLWLQRRSQYRTELKAFASAERNETILNSTIDAMLILNPSGTVETINAAATRMLGYLPQDLVRRDISVLADIAPGSSSFHERIGLTDGRLRASFITDRMVRHRDGHLVPVDIALGVMSLPDGDHIVASLRDIAERKRVERLKDELISTVSHELRTPLTSIVGAMGLLSAGAAGKLSPQATHLVQIAENNSRRLIRLINDMLDVDRMDSGKLKLALHPVDLRDVVTRACEGNQGLAQSHDARIECTVPDDVITVTGDDERLVQVITNLTSNAVKASPPGGTVSVGIERYAEGRKAMVFVDDDGSGVLEEFRGRIFGRFERAENDEGSAGTGLGLAIAREIVMQHSGEIWFEDRPGGGTRFAFSVPVTRPVALSKDIDHDAKILICEGDAKVARALQSFLTYEGYTCRVVTTAAAAREALARNGYNVLMLDMALDDEDAFALAREVRRQDGPEKLSILMVSAHEVDDDNLPISLDLVDWIEKPIDPHRLKTAVRAAVRRSGVERPVVLHLDDDHDTLEVTASALEGEAAILKATTLDEARALLRRTAPHLAILDVHLEQGSGLDLIPELFDRDGAVIPTIIYSAHDVTHEVAATVDAVLVKSRSSLPDLKATIRRVVATRHKSGDGD